jgi:hypothetical protein
VGDTEDYQVLAPSAPYVPRPRPSFHPTTVIGVIKGERSASHNPYPTKLGQYKIPRILVDALENGAQDVGQVIKRLPSDFRPTTLSRSSYITRLKTQLWVEEHKAT